MQNAVGPPPSQPDRASKRVLDWNGQYYTNTKKNAEQNDGMEFRNTDQYFALFMD